MQCGRISATRTFINQLGERDVRHMIIGPGCSSGAVTVAENAPGASLMIRYNNLIFFNLAVFG